MGRHTRPCLTRVSEGYFIPCLLEKMEVTSRVAPFDRVLPFLEVIGLHDFRCAVNFT